MACRRDAQLRAIFNRSALTVPDGMGTVWFLRALGHKAGRVYGPDLLLAVCQHGVALGWRHFFLGGAPGVVERLIAKMITKHPDLKIAGTLSPIVGEHGESPSDVVDVINTAQPDIVWVGLGSPKQEYWMAAHRDKLNAPVLVGVGAAFDFLSGTKPQAPAWVQRAGLEWLFRLLTEPRRLWRRYAGYPLFVLLALAQILGLARYPAEEKA
jgi:N-acetylglucosaminyldiphosphoundecaprenol N-acetyl-beta-D-mannosaminyltransferase